MNIYTYIPTFESITRYMSTIDKVFKNNSDITIFLHLLENNFARLENNISSISNNSSIVIPICELFSNLKFESIGTIINQCMENDDIIIFSNINYVFNLSSIIKNIKNTNFNNNFVSIDVYSYNDVLNTDSEKLSTEITKKSKSVLKKALKDNFSPRGKIVITSKFNLLKDNMIIELINILNNNIFKNNDYSAYTDIICSLHEKYLINVEEIEDVSLAANKINNKVTVSPIYDLLNISDENNYGYEVV